MAGLSSKGQEAVTIYCFSLHNILVTAPIQTQMQISKVWGHLWQGLKMSLMMRTTSPEVPRNQEEGMRRCNWEGA